MIDMTRGGEARLDKGRKKGSRQTIKTVAN